MENNQLAEKELAELKAYVACLYYGQNVAWCENSAGDLQSFRALTNTMFDEIEYLQLRPLSSITDAEAIEVAKLSGFNYEDDLERAISYDTTLGEKNANDYYINRGKSQVDRFVNSLNFKAYQYLIQQSFALPVFFKGVQYSVEDLVSKGIITLLKS